MKTIRELVSDYQKEVRDTDLLPGRASEILAHLSAIIGNCNDEIRLRDVEYNKRLLKAFADEEKANRAKIVAETSPEYIAKREARDTKELVVEMIGSLKYYLRSKAEEYKLSNF